VIGFALRLAVAGGREAIGRLVIIASAVAIGVGLLLTTLAGVNAVNTQNARYGWLNSSAQPATGTADPLWWKISGDYFEGLTVGRVDVAPTGPTSPVPPGIPALPGPGEFYASPALAALLATTPADQLGDRFPGHQIGTIGPAALPGPDSLIIVIGRTPAELSGEHGATQVRSIMTTDPGHCGNCIVGIRAAGLDLVLGVVAGALLFPVLIFIGSATRLSATRREQRFAAMRLVGATPRQVAMIATVESTLSALAGTLLGFALFYLFRDPLAAVNFTGTPFFASDLAVNVADIAAVAIGIPAAAAVAARLSLRRVRISPLGVTRRVTPRPPRAYRLIPLAAGVAELVYTMSHRPDTAIAQVEWNLTGFLIITIGLVVAGPWLTMVGSRLVARRSRRPATLIAARRLADNPQAGFRAVSGLILALFVTSAAVGIIGTIVANRGVPSSDARSNNLLAILRDAATPVPAAVGSIPGVHGVVATHRAPESLPTPPDQGTNWFPFDLARCGDIAANPTFGRCAPGAEVAWVYPDLIGPSGTAAADIVWPTAPVTPAELAALPMDSVVVGTDGSTAAIERARTVLLAAYPDHNVIATGAEWDADSRNLLTQWKQLADVAVVASLVIAGCSLAVSVAGGVNDRKRPFSMLRLTGVPLTALRKVVAVESAVPLLAAAVVAIGMGLLAAQLFLTGQMHYSLSPPGAAYYLIVLGGLAASLGIIASTLPLLRRITGPETARNE
jgi:hypothetical protein